MIEVKKNHRVSTMIAHEAVNIGGMTHNTHGLLFNGRKGGEGYQPRGTQVEFVLHPLGVLTEATFPDGKTEAKLVPWANLRSIELVQEPETK